MTRKPHWLHSFRRTRRWAWVAFALIALFTFAQVGWWMVFQRGYVQDNITGSMLSWLQEAELAQNALRSLPVDQQASFALNLQARFPHLQVTGDSVALNPAWFANYRERELRYLRMFSYEGPFFLAVVLVGLYVIGLSLRSEAEFKRRQQNFLMATTHEFRTPISTLRLLTESLQLRELPRAKQLVYLTKMGQELDRLKQLGEHILATARLEQGLAIGQIKQEDLNRVVHNTVESQRGGLEARGATLHLEWAAQSLPVELDAQAFDLVVSNLLDNALKYSPDAVKPIWVRVGSEGKRVFVQVEDHGVGIPRKEQTRIFEPFYRSGSEMTRSTKGLGLGLYLVRNITELFGGQVVCEALPRGTRFTLWLPLAEPIPAAETQRSPA
jgi:signal transduction histidine kinase